MSTCSNVVFVSATLLTATALFVSLPSSKMTEDCVDWNAQMDRVDDAYQRQLNEFSHCYNHNPSTATEAEQSAYVRDCTGSEAEERSMDLFHRTAYVRDNKPTNCKRTRILDNPVHFKNSNKPQNHQKAHR